jgi:Arc/MetJ family transcription regulator
MIANIELDDKLVEEARRFTGVQDATELTHIAFEHFIQGQYAAQMLEFEDSDCWESNFADSGVKRTFADTKTVK